MLAHIAAHILKNLVPYSKFFLSNLICDTPPVRCVSFQDHDQEVCSYLILWL